MVCCTPVYNPSMAIGGIDTNKSRMKVITFWATEHDGKGFTNKFED